MPILMKEIKKKVALKPEKCLKCVKQISNVYRSTLSLEAIVGFNAPGSEVKAPTQTHGCHSNKTLRYKFLDCCRVILGAGLLNKHLFANDAKPPSYLARSFSWAAVKITFHFEQNIFSVPQTAVASEGSSCSPVVECT